ncbi:MAG: hypothetical protein ACODAQ_11725 [Phycisphaeraceae bacterium]
MTERPEPWGGRSPRAYPAAHRQFLVELLRAHPNLTRTQILDAAVRDGRHKEEVTYELEHMVKWRDIRVEDPPGGGEKVFRLP